MTPEEEQWRQEHGVHPVPARHLAHWCLMYSVAAIICLLVYATLIRWLQRGRAPSPGDSMLLLYHWPRLVRKTLPLILVLLLVVPLLVFIFAYLGAAILAPIEAWPYLDTFEYLLRNMVALPPMSDLAPTTSVGTVVVLIVSIIDLVLASLVIGFCAAMAWVLDVQALVPGNCCGAALSIFLISFVLCVVGVGCGTILAWLEGFAVWDAFLFTMSVMCDLGNPLTSVAPMTAKGNLFATLCSVVGLGVAGAIVGILGGHPRILQAVIMIGGKEGPTQDSIDSVIEQTATKCLDVAPPVSPRLGHEPFAESTQEFDIEEADAEWLEGLERELSQTGESNAQLCLEIKRLADLLQKSTQEVHRLKQQTELNQWLRISTSTGEESI